MLSTRTALLLALTVALQAQHTITAEFKSAKLPKEVPLKIELGLVFSLQKTTTQEGGFARLNNSQPSLKQISKNTAVWTISYDDDGNPVV